MRRIGIVTALMAEAAPIINFYRLQKQAKHAAYHHFRSESIDLLVCGMGADKMRFGLKAYFENSAKAHPTIWINIGIAGTKFHEVGDLLWAKSIDGKEIGIPESAINQTAMNVVSLTKPSTEYKANCLFDMEANTFLKMIKKNLSDLQISSVFCAKVVSDNAGKNTLKMDKRWVTGLIQKNLDSLDKEINKLIKSNR